MILDADAESAQQHEEIPVLVDSLTPISQGSFNDSVTKRKGYSSEPQL